MRFGSLLLFTLLVTGCFTSHASSTMQVDIVGFNGLVWGSDVSLMPRGIYPSTSKAPLLAVYSTNQEYMSIPAIVSYGFTSDSKFNWCRVSINRYENVRDRGLSVLTKLIAKYGKPARFICDSEEREPVMDAGSYVESWRPMSRQQRPHLTEIVWRDKDGDGITIRLEEGIQIEYYSSYFDRINSKSGY